MFDHVWIVCLKQALEEATRQLREQEVPEFEANIGMPGIHFRENPRTSKNKHNTGHTGLIVINYPGFMIPLCSSAQKSTFPSAIFSLSRVSGLQWSPGSALQSGGTSYSFGEAGAAMGVTWGQWLTHPLYQFV